MRKTSKPRTKNPFSKVGFVFAGNDNARKPGVRSFAPKPEPKQINKFSWDSPMVDYGVGVGSAANTNRRNKYIPPGAK